MSFFIDTKTGERHERGSYGLKYNYSYKLSRQPDKSCSYCGKKSHFHRECRIFSYTSRYYYDRDVSAPIFYEYVCCKFCGTWNILKRDLLLSEIDIKKTKFNKPMFNSSSIKYKSGGKMGIMDSIDYGWKELLAGGIIGYLFGNKKALKKIRKKAKEFLEDDEEDDEDDKPKKKQK